MSLQKTEVTVLARIPDLGTPSRHHNRGDQTSGTPAEASGRWMSHVLLFRLSGRLDRRSVGGGHSPIPNWSIVCSHRVAGRQAVSRIVATGVIKRFGG